MRALHARADILRESRDALLLKKHQLDLWAGVALLVDREIAAIECALFTVEKQIIELGRIQRQKPGRLTHALYGPAYDKR
jgi:hypothetical protein